MDKIRGERMKIELIANTALELPVRAMRCAMDLIPQRSL